MKQELATHAPMMIRVPGLTDKGMRSMAYLIRAKVCVRVDVPNGYLNLTVHWLLMLRGAGTRNT